MGRWCWIGIGALLLALGCPEGDDDTTGDDDVADDDGADDDAADDDVSDDDAGDDDTGPTSLEYVDTVDWTGAGYPGEIPDLTQDIIDVTAQGAACDGSTNDAGTLQAAIDGAPSPAVLLLPTGTCRIESVLQLRSGIVLRGAGSEATTLECQCSDGCLEIDGSAGDWVDVVSGGARGTTELEVADASVFAVGGGIELEADDVVPASADWGEDAPGQMGRVVAIAGDTLTLDPPMHLSYDGLNPRVRPTNFVEQVGIEDLTLLRVDDGGDWGSNIVFDQAADCWVRRVESDWTERYHVSIGESLHLEIRDSYLHDAKSKGDGGQGYGVSMAYHTTLVLVENNVFRETRHSMIVQVGVNACVYGYNYSERNYSDDGWDKAYISLHGHYPFMNLFEGNIVGWAYLGDYWGEIGPGNTLYRNRVMGTDQAEGFGEHRGIALRYYHGPQYVVGNELVGGEIYFADDATGDPADAVLHGNNVGGDLTWDPAIADHDLIPSLYLAAKPAFLGTLDWPPLGGDLLLGDGTIPALQRWDAGTPVEQP